ncbi:MAG: ORF6N domain-containing protein [Candidatus Pacebacteria bacterium]|nr:ORF6N domain-containing protein [Candidatus Paceibacterota bacterium]
MTHQDIKNQIYYIRGRKVMFDRDLALLYGVPTKQLNQAVKRNVARFPEDFMFQLSVSETEVFLRSQFVTSNNLHNNPRSQTATLDGNKVSLRSQFATSNRGGLRYGSYVFTEQGIAMLSSILNSEKAIRVNIQIIRIFTKLREMVDSHKELREKIESLEKKYDGHFKIVFQALRQFLIEEEKPKEPIGFRPRD